MNAELKRLFEGINFIDENQSFSDVQIVSLKFYTKRKEYLLELSSREAIKFSAYHDLKDALNSCLEIDGNIIVHTQINGEENNFKDYLEYFIDQTNDVILKNSLDNFNFEFNDEVLFTFKTKLVYEQFCKFESDLNKKLEDVGFNLTFNSILKEEEIVRDDDYLPNYQPVKKVEPVNKVKQVYRRGSSDQYVKINLNDIVDEAKEVIVEGEIFLIDDLIITKNDRAIQTFYVTDYQNSITCKRFESARLTKDDLKVIKKGDFVRMHGDIKNDSFAKELVFFPNRLEVISKPSAEKDNAEIKRIELHAHTKMSEMDGVCDAAEIINQAAKFGHKGVAICDHMVIQSFPLMQQTWAKIVKEQPDFKVIYGCEMNMVNSKLDIVKNVIDKPFNEAEYIVFDIETTGLSSRYDQIIEIAAFKMSQGTLIDKFQTFVNPQISIPTFISQKTNIFDKDVKDAPTIEKVLVDLLNFFQDLPLVAHNAKFDIGFINENLIRNNMDPLKNCVIDTLDLAKAVLPDLKAYNLGRLARYYKIEYKEEVAHRADYDTEVLASVLIMLLKEAEKNGINNIKDLDLLNNENSFKKVFKNHVTLLAKNSVGLKNLFKLVSLSHIDYLVVASKSQSKKDEAENGAAEPRIIREKINELREGLLIGTACSNGEIFELAANRSEKELEEALKFYDYVEVQPLENYRYLLDRHAISSYERLEQVVRDIIAAANKLNKIVVATGDVHYCLKHQKIYRDIYINTQAIGGVRHPLYVYNSEARMHTVSPMQHYRTTEEMLEAFSFLNEQLAYDIVVSNTNKIFEQIEVLKPLKDKLYPPSIEGADDKLTEICYANAHKLYGENLPDIVIKRIEKELNSIISNGYGIMYYIAHLLVKKSNEDGYVVGSRGSVGSSFVATMTNITEVNPLIPHYRCPNCAYSEFIEDNSVASGYDLPDKCCPHCQTKMIGDGQDIPFETFLGFKGDKVPDIDLNFSGAYQEHAHAYTKVLFGEDKVYRAGTIGTVAEKTAFGYVLGYFEDIKKDQTLRNAEKIRLASAISDVKRTTGQHPGGIIVIPNDKDVHDFTPVQYPANNPESDWKTTHFDFHAIHDNVLKLDILGHVDPTVIRLLQNITNIEPKSIPLNDPLVMSLFSTCKGMGINPEDLGMDSGALGLPEFGTNFVRRMLDATKPTTFSELVQISGLSHGTDVWTNNAEELVNQGICSLKEVIGCRDDIMVYLINKGLVPKTAFDIMESVRKGKGLKEEHEKVMKENNVPDWYIDSCKKIKYMFPKAHAVAYVLMAVRISWFKIYKPLEYYAVYFSARCDVFEVETAMNGVTAIKNRLNDIKNRLANPETKKSVTNKENSLITVLEVCLEMCLRGFKIGNISLEKSEADLFKVDYENKAIIPSFISLDGLGISVAQSVVEARNQRPFISKEDLKKRTSLNDTLIKKLEYMNVLEGLSEENQLSLF